MDNLMPPPNSSPEEIQAWNSMMDTMVTFIKASTHLMNTITQKVRVSSSKPGASSNIGGMMGGCEPECEVCRPKPPCGICRKDAPTAVRASLSAPSKKPSSTVKIVITPPTPEISKAKDPEQAPEGDGEAGGETAEGEGEAPAADEEPAPVEEPADVEAPNSEGVKVPPTLSPSSELPPAEPQAPPAAGDKQCICAAIRAKRLESGKKAKCSCGKKKKKNIDGDMIEEEDEDEEDEPPAEEPPDGNTAATIQEMVEKLANAQREITQLQEEMARLQRMDASKRTGPHAGPNPAALYREIMKGNGARSFQPPPQAQRIPQQVRRPLTQTSNIMSPINPNGTPLCIPYDEMNRGGLPSSFGDPQEIMSTARPMMRPSPMQQQPGGRSNPQYYAGGQAPCRSFPPSGGQSLEDSGYGRSSPSSYDSSPDPNYWSRLGEYGSPAPASQRQMIVCPSNRGTPQESPPRRMIICGPPPRTSDNCDPNCNHRSM